jgi:acetyl-CoA carboxylase alpha subunit
MQHFKLARKKKKMDQILTNAAKQLEKQLDNEIDRLDNLTVDDIDAIREKRLKEMKQRQEKVIQWKANVIFYTINLS